MRDGDFFGVGEACLWIYIQFHLRDGECYYNDDL